MATSKTTNTYNRQNWEDADFPILCQTCLGDNPYIRMTKEKYGKECKICNRPFTVFRWCPGAKMRFKKTEVCQTCSKLKNVCQTCLLDLEYGLPIQVRDSALKHKDDLPKSDVNKEYYIQNIENQLARTESSGLVSRHTESSDILTRLARTAPYYKRNRPHVCSFWVKGECRRGEECPYRHEKPTDPEDPLADQNIRDRYYGVNDPVADKLLKRASTLPTLEPPDDKTITTLYIGNLGTLTEQDIRDHFYQFGEIRTISLVAKQQCAFVQFTTRAAAELAADKTFNKIILGGRRLVIKWGRSQGRTNSSHHHQPEENYPAVPGLPGALPEISNNFFNLEPGHIPLPNIPPPPSLMVPPMFGPPPLPPFFFNHGPPQIPTSFSAPPTVNNSSTSSGSGNATSESGVTNTTPTPAVATSSPLNIVDENVAANVPPPKITNAVHYPSQDPARLGATQITGQTQE